MDNTQRGPAGCGDMIADVVAHISYKPGWTVRLEDIDRVYEHLAGGRGLTLVVDVAKEDSTTPGNIVGLTHFFIVPPALYDRETWERWVLEQILLVEQHEALEFFKVDGWAPFFPPHGEQCGRSPYTIERRAR